MVAADRTHSHAVSDAWHAYTVSMLGAWQALAQSNPYGYYWGWYWNSAAWVAYYASAAAAWEAMQVSSLVANAAYYDISSAAYADLYHATSATGADLQAVRNAAAVLREAKVALADVDFRNASARADSAFQSAAADLALANQLTIDSEQLLVEQSRAEVVDRLAEAFGLAHLTAHQRIICRGWVGFLEAASLEWLHTRSITKNELAQLLETSVNALMPRIGKQSRT